MKRHSLAYRRRPQSSCGLSDQRAAVDVVRAERERQRNGEVNQERAEDAPANRRDRHLSEFRPDRNPEANGSLDHNESESICMNPFRGGQYPVDLHRLLPPPHLFPRNSAGR